jgi:multidrug efflux system membrane fusion protein
MKSIISLLFFIFFIFSGWVGAQNYELAQISVTPYEKSIQRVGKVAFKRTLKLAFKSSGYLKKLSVDEGDFFSNKQLLASLNTEELKATKNSRYAQLLQAKREVNRVKKLIEQGLSSQQIMDQVQTNVETTRASYKIAYYNLEKSELIAPFDGVVLTRFSELAEFQATGNQVLEVAAVENNLVVKVALTDTEVNYVKLGQSVQIHLANLGMISGRISKVPFKSNNQSQLYLVEVTLSKLKAGEGAVAGQLAQVILNFSTDNFIYQVPISALIEIDNNGSAILMIKSKEGEVLNQSFDVLNIDSQYLYIKAQSSNDTLDVVINGWQKLKLGEQ